MARAAVYRVLTLVSAVGRVPALLARRVRLPRGRGRGARRDGGVDGRLTATSTCAARRGRPATRARAARVADLVVTFAVMATTLLVQTPAQIAADAPVMGSIWTSGAVLACALAFGVPRRDRGRGWSISAALAGLPGARSATELCDIQLLVARRADRRVRVHGAAPLGRAAAPRRRVRGGDAPSGSGSPAPCTTACCRCSATSGGAAPSWAARRGELGALAGEQEFALRTLLTTGPAPGRRATAAATSPPRCACSARPASRSSRPAHPVELPAHTVDELAAVVGAALANVDAARRPGRAGLGAAGGRRRRRGDQRARRGPGHPRGQARRGRGGGPARGGPLDARPRARPGWHDRRCDTGPDRGTEWIINLRREARA